MSNLYLVFLLVSVILFLLIVWYSISQSKKNSTTESRRYLRPLFEGLEQKKNETVTTKKTALSKKIPVLGKVFSNLRKQSSAEVAKPSNKEVSSRANHKKTKIDSAEATRQTAFSGADKTLEPNKKLERSPTKEAGNDKTEAQAKRARQDGMATELVAKILNDMPVEQLELLSIFRQHDYKFNRKVNIYGLNELTDQWCDIEFELPSSRYSELGISIQLADRNGAISTKELHDYQQMVLAFVNKYDSPFNFSIDLNLALEQAQKLDKLGQRYDSMAVLNVVPRNRTEFRVADVKSCASDLMMTVDDKGVFIKIRGSKQNLTILYRLACADGQRQFGVNDDSLSEVRELVLYLVVPRTENPQEVFLEMVDDAKNLATWLDGKVVDRQRKTMTHRSYSVLSRQIEDIAKNMQGDGLVPGDSVCKKLF